MKQVTENAVLSAQEQILELKNQIKKLQSEAKVAKVSPTAKKVRFTNTKGEVIEGYGELYYYVKDANGKYHAKRDNQCTIIE